jgi:hypothetical protein
MPRIETTFAAGGDRTINARPRWRLLLDLFLRTLAIGHLVWSLWEWAAILGLVPPIFSPHQKALLPRLGATYFFAALDPMAAVGLWFGSVWGIATWLVVTFARIVIHTGYAGLFGWTGPWTIVQAVTILVYVALFLLAERADREARKKHRRTRAGG